MNKFKLITVSIIEKSVQMSIMIALVLPLLGIALWGTIQLGLKQNIPFATSLRKKYSEFNRKQSYDNYKDKQDKKRSKKNPPIIEG